MRSVPIAIASMADLRRWARGNGLEIVLLVTGAVLLARFTRWIGDRVTVRIDRRASDTDALVRSEDAKHRHALAQVVTWSTVVLIASVNAILVVQRLGIPLTSLVAPATVAGVAIGFGAQRVVQDLLAGMFIIAERQYGFGDVIRISPLGTTTGVTGTVEDVTLRVTRLRTINGEVVIIPNGAIQQVINQSRDWARAVVDVPVPSTADVNKVTSLLRDVGAAAVADADLRPLLLDAPSVMGVESIDVNTFSFRLVARTLPGRQFEVSRALRSRVAQALVVAGITVPAPPEAAT